MSGQTLEYEPMKTIYRDFDQAGLDAAYNNRAHVPHSHV